MTAAPLAADRMGGLMTYLAASVKFAFHRTVSFRAMADVTVSPMIRLPRKRALATSSAAVSPMTWTT